MAVELLTNNPQSTASGSIDGVTNPVTFSVASAAAFPLTGNFRIIIDSEILLVTNVSGNSFTCTRAQEGTSIATHSAAATVTHVVTAASLPLLVSQSETFANRPAAGVAGRLFFPTGGPFFWRDNGVTWDLYANGFGPMNPNVSDFTTWVNQSSAVISSVHGFNTISWTGSQVGTENLNMRVKSLPGGNWTMTLAVLHNRAPGASSNFGIVIRNSSDSKIIGHGIRVSNNTLNGYQWTNSTTFNNNIFNDSNSGFGPLYFIQLVYDGTNYSFRQSGDFVNWHENRAFTASGTFVPNPDQVGYYLNVNGNRSNQTESISILHAVLG